MKNNRYQQNEYKKVKSDHNATITITCPYRAYLDSN